MDEVFVAWAAGFFDGEGTVHASLHQRADRPTAHVRLTIIVVQTTPAPLQALQAAWGGYLRDRPADNPRHRHQWRWQLHGRHAVPFLRAVLPHLRVKREVVQLGLALAALIGPQGLRVLDAEASTRASLVSAIHGRNAASRSRVA